MQEKRFSDWIKLKEKIHFCASMPRISDGEIWWCSCGENVGAEINGKSRLFSRPVFIYKKLDRLSFIGIPLSSQIKIGSWYVNFNFCNKPQTAVLSQIRTFSVFRLSNRMGTLDTPGIEKIKTAVLKLLR